MKKKWLIALISLCCAATCAFGFVSCGDDSKSNNKNNGNPQNNESETISESENGLSFKTLSVNNLIVYGEVSNQTETFSFIDEIDTNKKTKYTVALDLYGTQVVASKTIPLQLGDNIVYIIETVNDEPIAVYTTTIHRKYMCYVEINTGYSWESKEVEEGSLISKPATPTTRIGCSFKGWDYDFTAPITNGTIINAIWEPLPEMKPFIFWSSPTECILEGVYSIYETLLTELTVPNIFTYIGESSFANCNTLKKVVISNNIIGIGENAFNGCSELAEIILPNSLINIESSAFYNCKNLKRIIIPNNVTNIGEGAFQNCTNLSDVIIGTNVITIEKDAFNGCSSLQNVSFGDTLQSIGPRAFYNCYELKNIIIPNSIIEIGFSTFFSCDNLTNIKFMGTIDEWDLVEKGNNWAIFTPATEVVCSNGTVALEW